jgi:NAD(P)-dependent dehydrogenase (short-subunit alcohol dehydrogenase family)/acyl carrier protein
VMSRHEADAHAREVMHRLESQGVQVVLTLGDVSQREDVEAALAKIARTMPPLAGIIHAAGVLDDGVITAQNWSRFATVMGPKVLGTWHLHWLTRDLPIPLDFMVLFSSGASLAGSPGQANHAAANAFEDAFAWYRQAQNRPTIAINWGPWSAIGAAATRKLDHPAFLKQIAPDDGLLALDFAMRRTSSVAPFERAQLAVLAADWSLLRDMPNGAGDQRLFTELMATAPARRDGNDDNKSSAGSISAVAPDGAAGTRQTLHERLLATLPNRRHAVLRDAIRAIAAKVLGLAEPKELDVNEPLRQLGLDSLMSVELRNLLGKAVEQTLPVTITFDYPSVVALSDHLAATKWAPLFATVHVAGEDFRKSASPSVVSNDMSEDELAMALASRLNRIGTEGTK